MDEAQFLIQQTVTVRSRPKKLDWLRTSLVDKGVPVLLVFTPQGVSDWERFEQVTNYTSEQFYGRLCVDGQLPEVLAEEDIDLVAKAMLEGYPGGWAELVAARAMRAKSGLQAVEAIVKRAWWHSHQAGRDKLTPELIEKACDELVPLPPQITPVPALPVSVLPLARAATAETRQEPSREAAPARRGARLSSGDRPKTERASPTRSLIPASIDS